VARFARAYCPVAGPDGTDYDALYAWSLRDPAAFWAAVWQWSAVIADRRPDGTMWDRVVRGFDRMAPPDPVAGPSWFEGARLNFAENLLRRRDDGVALIGCDERGRRREWTWARLAADVARTADAVHRAGIAPGDRVAGIVPNAPEAVIAMLGAASLGAIWSSCSPDFGPQGILDRFGQIAPRVLFVADGYTWAGKAQPVLGKVAEVLTALPSVERVVVFPFLDEAPALDAVPRATPWEAFLSEGDGASLAFTRLPFDHPLYVMYSSGTTGLPKCLVHGAGGTLLQHLKELALHVDIGPADRVLYYTTCGWMMWNWVVSGLALGATVVCYDGAPLAPRPTVLWDAVAAERVTVFGTSAKFLALSEKAGVRPTASHDLAPLRTILSTGSPLAPPSFDYVLRDVRPGVHLASISGGTDLVSCFALGTPLRPVHRGELQCRGLGMHVDVWRDDGTPAPVGEAGELVCTAPFPSMPVRFWGDADGAAYRAAYFAHFPGVWRHGDWAERTPHDGLVIHGRSDATLNPGGVRIGTAEIYRVVEQFPEVRESVVIGREVRDGAGGTDVEVALFVRPTDGVALDDALVARLRAAIRQHASPHHVPRLVLAVQDIPRTISGKITELAVREAFHGRPVLNTGAMANPEALEEYRELGSRYI
jgi:acetoacetyl-CoA synthetase